MSPYLSEAGGSTGDEGHHVLQHCCLRVCGKLMVSYVSVATKYLISLAVSATFDLAEPRAVTSSTGR